MNQQINVLQKNQTIERSSNNAAATTVPVRSYVGVLYRYADEIIGDRHGDYIIIEINGVCDLSATD